VDGSTGDADADAVIDSYTAPPIDSYTAPPKVTGDDDADAVIHSFTSKKEEKKTSMLDKVKNVYGSFLEPAASMVTGAIAKPVSDIAGLAATAHDAVTGSEGDPEGFKKYVQEGLTYQPRTEAGQGAVKVMGDVADATVGNVGRVASDYYGGASRALGLPEGVSEGIEHGVTEAVNQAPGIMGAKALPRLTAAGAPEMTAEGAQSAMNAAQGGKSMGAASTAPDIMNASPELQKGIIDTARKTGGAVNPDVLSRRIEADSLPVKMKLTEGQATQDPSVISNEMNMRGKHPELAQAYNEQNGQLVDNLRSIREAAGPDVFSTNPVEHGDTLIDAYKQKGAAADADISAKYKALKDAAGGQFPVDAGKLLSNATDSLHKELLFDHAPSAVMSTLGRLADKGNMTFENFESLRTNIARIQRSAADGNEKAAAGVIRGEMENLPLAPGAASLKPLADTARAAAKTQFSALEADPAYKAAVNDEVPPDKFVGKFITGPSATRDSVATMKGNLADNDRASQTMGVAALDHLRDQAKIDSMGNGNFASASFNKHLEAMRPKLGSLVAPEQAQQLDALGNVSRYTTAQPKGSFVNNSNTFVSALAGHGASALEGVANVAAHWAPVGTFARKALEGRSAGNAVKRALNPASGLDRLEETNKTP
jgi:hypothetical protein